MEIGKELVSNRINTSIKGSQLVKREIKEKGVAMVLAEEAITQYTFEIEYEKAMRWVHKKLRSSKKDSFQKQQQKIQATLMQKGFTQDVIQEVMAEIKHEKDPEQDHEEMRHHG